MYGRRRSSREYSEGPVRGKCKRCGAVWTISANADDGWRNQCPNARHGDGCDAPEGEYRMDPLEDPHRDQSRGYGGDD